MSRNVANTRGVESRRQKGTEWKIAGWVARHPCTALVPGAAGAGVVELGASTMSVSAGATAAALGAWYRAHPDTFDRWITPRASVMAPPLVHLRRPEVAQGHGGRRAVHHPPQDRRRPLPPRDPGAGATRRTWTPSGVTLARGQRYATSTDRAEDLAAALNAERVGVEKVRPRVVALIVQHREPFTEVIDAPEMPTDTDAVDTSSIYLGEDEFGGEWRESLDGNHWFIAGATNAGKELDRLGPAAHPRADDPRWARQVVGVRPQTDGIRQPSPRSRTATPPPNEDCADLIAEYVEDMQATQKRPRRQGQRKTPRLAWTTR